MSSSLHSHSLPSLPSLHFASHPFAAQPQWRVTRSSHPVSDESNAKKICSPRLTKDPSFLDKILLLNTNFLALAACSHLATLSWSCHLALALQHGMALALLTFTRVVANTDSLNASSPKRLFLHSTPGIFFGSNTTRTSLDRATALDARRSVSEICLRGGCRFHSAAQCPKARGLNLQVVASLLVC